MLNELRNGLFEAFKHRHVVDAWCIACGRDNAPMTLHVIEFYHDDKMRTPDGLVPMSQSRGTTRGGVPLCNVCFPPCRECALPIATPWTKKLLGAIAAKHSGVSFVIGNGICKHVHVLHDAKSLFRSVTLATGAKHPG